MMCKIQGGVPIPGTGEPSLKGKAGAQKKVKTESACEVRLQGLRIAPVRALPKGAFRNSEGETNRLGGNVLSRYKGGSDKSAVGKEVLHPKKVLSHVKRRRNYLPTLC